MRHNLKLLSLLGLCLCLISGCKKLIDVIIRDPGNSLAAFNLVTSSQGCPVVITQGNFRTGVNLKSTDNIKLQVDVLKPGAWRYSTDTLNGFSFSSEGVFANKGRQNITLSARGIPAVPGNYAFTLDTSSSTVLIRVLKNETREEPVGNISYFKGTFGGVEFDFNALTSNPDSVSWGSGGVDTMGFSSFVGSGVAVPGIGQMNLSIQRDFLFNGKTSTDTDFKNLFRPGAYAFQDYRNPCIPIGSTSGVAIFLSGQDGDDWGTVSGSRNQEGSSFEIVGIEDGYSIKGKYYVKVKARLNCKLYSRKTGAMKLLTDAEVVSFFLW